MKILIFSISFFFILPFCDAQSMETLRSQLEYCKKESYKAEASVETYKALLEIQGTQIRELKTQIEAQDTEIKNLKSENNQLQSVAISLVELGSTYESMGKYQEAIEIYKLLIKSYPSSMEAISSRLKIIDIKKKETINISK